LLSAALEGAELVIKGPMLCDGGITFVIFFWKMEVMETASARYRS
jgi:hypothetical protein